MHKKEFSFMGIRTKLSLSIILMLLFMTVLFDLVVYQIYRQDIEEKELSSMEDANEILADNIKNLIANIEENLMNEISRCNVFDYQSSLPDTASASVERKMKGLSTLMHFRGIDCKNIFILDKYTCRFFYDSQVTGTTLDDFRKRQVYKEIAAGRETLFQSRGSTTWRSFPDQPDEIYIIKSYVEPFDMDYKGIICLTIEREIFRSLLGDHKFDSIIYDEHGGLLYDSRDITAETYPVEPDEWSEYLCTETTIHRRKGEWRLIGLIAKSEAFGEISALFKMLTAVETVVILIMIYIVYRVTKGFLWNIMALTDNFKQINAGGQITKIVPHSHDETTYLCEQFDSMYDQLKENAEQMAFSSILLERAEYNSLVAQMNPHFLYNTLESISAMAKLSGQDNIVRVIQMLSHLLRASLGGGKQEIPLKQEFIYIRYYLELQRIVAGGRITWDIVTDDGVEECPVPKLILQPIVENAIIHGVNEILDDAVIIITAVIKDNRLVLEVCDNGKGAEQEIIDALLAEERELPERENHEDRAHIGIRSIQKRLHILYGSEYGLEMDSEPGNGMVVRLNLPYRKGNDLC